MKVLLTKEGGFYSNKFLPVVLVMVVGVLALIVYANVLPASIRLDAPGTGTVNYSYNSLNELLNLTCTILNVESGDRANVTIVHNFTGTFLANNSNEGNAPGGDKNTTKEISLVTDQNRPLNFTINVTGLNFASGVWACNVSTAAEPGSGNLSSNNTISFDSKLPSTFYFENSTSATSNNSVVANAVNNHITVNWSTTTEEHLINYTVLVWNSTTINDTYLVAINKSTSVSIDVVNVSPRLGGNFPDGNYYWKVLAWQNTTSTNGSSTNSSTGAGGLLMSFVVDTGMNNATQLNPANATWNNNGTLDLVYQVNDGNINACSLFLGNVGGVLTLNNTNSSGLSSGLSTTFITKLDQNQYIRNVSWLIQCNDTGNNAGNTTIRDVFVDAILPNITYVGVTDAVNNSNRSRNYIAVEVAANDTYESNITFQLMYANGTNINTTVFTNQTRLFNFTGLNANRSYIYNITIRDFATNSNTTVTRAITLDNTAPIVAFDSATAGNNTYANQAYISINVSIIEANFSNVTFFLYNSSRNLVKNVTNYLFNTTASDGGGANFTFVVIDNGTALVDGSYEYNVTAIDSAGNIGSTVTRNITLDRVLPKNNYVGVTDLLNNSNRSQNYIAVEVAYNDTNPMTGATTLANITFLLAYANGTVINSTTFTNSTTIFNFTGLVANRTYTYNVSAKDYGSNDDVTITRTITLDNTAPVVAFSGFTLDNNTYFKVANVTINVSIIEANFSNITFFIYNSSNNLVNNVTHYNDITKNNLTFTQIYNGTGLVDGVYFFNVTVADSAGNLGSTPTRNITIDTTSPTAPVLGNFSLNGLLFGNGTIGSNITPFINWTASTETNFANYSVQVSTNDSSFGNLTNETFITSRTRTNASPAITTLLTNLASVDNRTYFIRVRAQDMAGNNGTSEVFNYTLDISNASITVSAPTAFPSIIASSTITPVSFVFTVTENNPDTCALYSNFSGSWKVNVTNTSIGGKFLTSQSVNLSTTIQSGTYVYNVQCNDSANPTNSRFVNESTNYTLVVDTSSPTINSTMVNGTTTSDRIIRFTIDPSGVAAINRSSITVTPNTTTASTFNVTRDCVSNSSRGFNCSYVEEGLTGGTHNGLVVSAKANGTAAVTFGIKVIPSAAYNYTLSLASGWNLVSIPLILENSTIDNALGNGTNTNVTRIYTLNNTGSNWLSWSSTASDDITTLESRKGYWIYTAGATNLFLFGNYTTSSSGTPLVADPLNFTLGWHLIGYSPGDPDSADNKHTENVMGDFGANTCRISGTTASGCYLRALYNATAGTGTINKYDVTAYNSDGTFDRGKGFLMRTTTTVEYLS
ncbi:hypothetical protein HYU13_00025 [Candidatus Woesearchaeota archaeon]|nr:hypothetical protein [Candidatus Woesearchaeota archaeon]